MSILVTGGNAHIGSRTCVGLLLASHEVVVLNNFSISYTEVQWRVEQITGKGRCIVEGGDTRDQAVIQTNLLQKRMHCRHSFRRLESVWSEAFSRANGQLGPYRRLSSRRPSDVARCYTALAFANQILGGRAKRDLAAICHVRWRWKKKRLQRHV